ncbi:MAG: substrate-binding domain-containing protein [Armatimonadota bacterium]|nr:substrate-binding domain-containing protein [Armatimonadota bacterium]
MSRRALSWIDAAIILVVLATVAGLYVSYISPGTPTLVIWSCGGNYHGLNAFSQRFEQRHHCRVQYTAAPIQYLLEQVAFGESHPDMLVGRAGPGWDALKKLGKLGEGPDFFGADPYVIITPAGNPAGITGIRDLGRPGVRVAYSPHAMRPKGKCPSHLMGMVASKFFPGLEERWENNAVGRLTCGRDLLEPITSGAADAAIVSRSQIAYPGVDRQALEIVPIELKHLDAMKVCRATIGQCVGILAEARHPELARRFRDAMLGELGREVFEEYGYIHITSPEVHHWDPFMVTFVPRRMPPWQVELGDRLAEEGIVREAIRRYLKVIHTFGPNEFEPYCRYQIGELLADQGRMAAAAEQWRRLIRDYPRPGPHEYGSPVFEVVVAGPELGLKPEEHYVKQARQALRGLPASDREEQHVAEDEVVAATSISAPRVVDGDPPKNGTRELALAEDLFAVGDYEYATRDYLKVLHLCYPSRYQPQASLRLGACAYLRGKPGLAKRQWEWTVAQFADSDAARQASQALQALGGSEAEQPESGCPVEMPPWQPTHDTWAERGMSYGMALYEHDLPLFTFKEMVKLLHGVYQRHTLGPQARYRAGIAAWEVGHPRAGILQWRICQAQQPQSPWAERSRNAIQAALQWPELTDEQRAEVEAAVSEPIPAVPKRNKPACWQRYSLGREFLMVGVLDEGQAAMEFMKALTVTHASKSKYDESVVPKAEAGLRRALCES